MYVDTYIVVYGGQTEWCEYNALISAVYEDTYISVYEDTCIEEYEDKHSGALGHIYSGVYNAFSVAYVSIR